MTTRSTIKRAIKSLFLVLILPIFALYWMFSRGGRSDGTFQSFSQVLSLFPGKTGIYLRAAFYRLACPATSDEISVGFLTVLSHRNTTIGRGVYIGPQCNIGMCSVGENTLIGSGVHILSGKHQHNFQDYDRTIQDQGGHFEKVSIGHDCWVGNQAVIMAPVSNRSIIAAGAVVTAPVGSDAQILAGNPAKVIKNRFETASSSIDKDIK